MSPIEAERSWQIKRFISLQPLIRAKLKAQIPSHARAQIDSAREKLTLVQLEVLVRLHEQVDPMTMSEIAEAQTISASAATQLVDSLEQLGMITRHHDPDDRRVVKVALSESTSDQFERLLQSHMAMLENFTAPLLTHELKQLVDLLEKLTRS